jgi:thiol-disulfide isomerase/thioredoxin
MNPGLKPGLIVTVLLCLVLSACGDGRPGPASGIGSLDTDGRWVVINYWATWCSPCREEIPELNEFAETHKDTVAVYAVNFDQVRGEDLLAEASAMGIAFTLLEDDPGASLGYARPTVLPTTIVIDANGTLVARLLGKQTGASLEAALQENAPE